MSDVGESLWFGTRLDELPREALYEVIDHLQKRLEKHTTPSAIRAHALGKVQMMMRGEA